MPRNSTDETAASAGPKAPEEPPPGPDILVDQMSEESFPASDAPAVWTWEVPEEVAHS